MLEAFEVMGIKSVALAAPWTVATNEQVANFLEASGVTVVHQEAMGYVRNSDVGMLPAQTAYDSGLRADRPDAEAIFLACGNWLTLDIVKRLEADTGKPVLTTNGCAWWAVLRMLGGHANRPDFGRLFEQYLSA